MLVQTCSIRMKDCPSVLAQTLDRRNLRFCVIIIRLVFKLPPITGAPEKCYTCCNFVYQQIFFV